MRWQPKEDRCPECGFGWDCDRSEAAAIVARAPADLAGLFSSAAIASEPTEGGWSATMYLWHLVDVLRIGAERLLTLALDPDAELVCWDENALAACRKYQSLSPIVGVEMIARAVRDWSDAAAGAPEGAVVVHPEFGHLDALDMMRRNAHEVHHHILDVRRRLPGLS